MSPKPRREARDRAEQTDTAADTVAAGTDNHTDNHTDNRTGDGPNGEANDRTAPGPVPTGTPWETLARFPLSRLGPEWFGPNWLTNTNWFGHWDHLFPTRWPVPFPAGPVDTFRIEEYDDGDAHVIRAEMPGLDPETDISIEVEHDVVSVSATREQRTVSEGGIYRSEFSYGTFRRQVRLPAGATADDVSASYDAGVLEIRITRPRPARSNVVPIRVRTGEQPPS